MTDTTDPREGGSECAVLLRNIDFAAAEFDGHPAIYEDAAAAIRALEAKVQDLEYQLDANGVSDMRNELAHVRVDRDGIAARLETYRDKWNSASAERDRLAGEVERLRREDDANTRELHDICNALPGVAFMDPPDGGSVSIAEQVRRMYAALQSQDAEVARLTSELAAAREDEMRLLWTFIDTGIDQIGQIDIHALACEINGSEDEMKDASYLQAIREAIDAARRAGEGER